MRYSYFKICFLSNGFQSRLLWKQDKSVVPDIGSGRGHFSPGNNFPPAADYVSGAFLSAVRDSSRRIKAGSLSRKPGCACICSFLLEGITYSEHYPLVHETVARLHLVAAIRAPIGRYLEPAGNPRPHSLPRGLAAVHSPPIAVADQACIGSRIAPVHVREILHANRMAPGHAASVSPWVRERPTGRARLR